MVKTLQWLFNCLNVKINILSIFYVSYMNWSRWSSCSAYWVSFYWLCYHITLLFPAYFYFRTLGQRDFSLIRMLFTHTSIWLVQVFIQNLPSHWDLPLNYHPTSSCFCILSYFPFYIFYLICIIILCIILHDICHLIEYQGFCLFCQQLYLRHPEQIEGVQ